MLTSLALGLTGTALAAPPGDQTFTVENITPDPGSWAVLIRFSHPVKMNDLRYRLDFLPRIKINWGASTQLGQRSIALKADFKAGKRHLLNISNRLKVDGRSYKKTVNSFTMPDHTPLAGFLDEDSVIEKDSAQMLHLQVVNVERLAYNSVSLPPVLLPLALSGWGGKPWPVVMDELDRAGQEIKSLSPDSLAPLLGKAAVTKQLFTAPGKKNEVRAFSIPLTFRKEKKRGSLELVNITAEDEHGRRVSDISRLFRITDLGLSYKLSDNELLVWATSLKTGLPQEGVSLFGYTKSLEVFPLGRTDRNGVLVYHPEKTNGVSLKTLGQFQEMEVSPSLIGLTNVAAVTGNDISYIRIRPKGDLTPNNIRQARRGQEKTKPLRGHLFTERGVYRPGDKVHFKGTVRQYKDGEIGLPEAKSCQVKIFNSKGAKIHDLHYDLSQFGTLWGELELKPYFPLGTYTLTMKYGKGDGQKVSRTFQVQEFRPPRHYAEIGFDRFERWDESFPDKPRLERLVKITVKGLYYAGGQVKHGRVRYKIHHASTEFQAVGYDDYTFGYSAEDEARLLESGESILDEKGRLVLEFPLDPEVLGGRYGLKVTASVIDFDGRTSAANKSFKVEPAFLVGLGELPESIKAGVGQALDLVVLDSEGQKIRHGKVKAEILQSTGAYVRKRNQAGELYWEYESLWRRLSGQDLELVNGQARFQFDFSYGGTYVVSATFRDDQGNAYSSARRISAQGDIYWDDYSNRDNPFETLDLVADQEEYRPGQTATVFLQPGRNIARYLVTLEQDRVLSHQIVEAEPGAQSIKIPIKEGHAPNVFVSVLGLTPRGAFPGRPLAYDEQAPSYVFGTLNLPVRQKTQGLEVRIGGGQEAFKAEPGAKVGLDLKALMVNPAGPKSPAHVELAVAVVDESVLALTAYQTPELNGLNSFDLPLAVFTGELRSLLLHQTPFSTILNRELTGGGGMAGTEELETRKYFNPVAYFNPSVITGPDGTARVEFTLPDTITRYRVFVVACDKGSAYANAQKDLTAVKDFYVEPGLPRFLTQGDRFTFGLKGFNTTKTAGSMGAAITSSPNLALDKQAQSTDLAADSTGLAMINGRALKPGPAWATFAARMGGLKDAVKTELPVNSGYIHSREALLGRFKGATGVAYKLPEGLAGVDWSHVGFDEVEVLLTVSGSPFLQMSKGLRYLLRYPYGCVEQTSSGVIPLAALKGLIGQGLIPDIKEQETEAFLKKGVDRLLAMQTGSGGLGYWPGRFSPHAWGSAYGAFALTVAQASGMKIEPYKMKSLLKYLQKTLKRGPRSQSYRALVVYILALNRSLDKSTLSQVGRDFENQSREAQLLLLLSLAEAGLGKKEQIIGWTREILGRVGQDNRADEFRARYREPALALLAGSKILGDNPLIDQAALRLLGGLSGQGIWSSTSDTGWALYALGRYFQGRAFPEAPVQVSATLPDGTTKTMEVQPKGFKTLSLDPKLFLINPSLKLTTAADNDLLYLLSVTLPRPDWSESGSQTGFIVSKSIENTDGTKEFKVGDLVKVRVRVETKEPTNRYVMLDDPLPAGLVAINSALKTEESVGGSSLQPSDEFIYWNLTDEGYYRFVPNFFEIKDERVLAFRDRLWTGAYEFSYYARAVCAGDFVVPPTKVEQMYSPEIHGFTKATRLRIKAR